jgi:hypothetical protein
MAHPNPPRDSPQPVCGQRAILATLYLLLTETQGRGFCTLHPQVVRVSTESLKILIAALSSSVAY